MLLFNVFFSKSLVKLKNQKIILAPKAEKVLQPEQKDRVTSSDMILAM